MWNFGILNFDFQLRSEVRHASCCDQSKIINKKSKIRPAAFTFAEVLFAVIVLGIGFIMIAAVFPVAITQSKATKEETTAASVVQQGIELISQAGQLNASGWQWNGAPQPPLAAGSGRWTDQALPHTYPFLSGTFSGPPLIDLTGYFPAEVYRGDMKPISTYDKNPYVERVAEMLRSSRINPSDPRFAWVAFYRRDVNISKGRFAPANQDAWKESPFNFAQIIVIGVQSQGEGHQVFNGNTSGTAPGNVDPESDVNQGYESGYTPGNYPVLNKRTNLDPRPIRVRITKNQNAPVGQLIVSPLVNGDPYFDNAVNAAQYVNAVAPGTFVIIAHDNFQGPSYGRMNGHLYKVGSFIKSVGTDDYYDLSPDGDFSQESGEDGISGNADDILGIGLSDATNGSQTSSVKVFNPAIAFVVGKPMAARNNAAAGFTGSTMDVSIYTTFIQVK
jgi:type II secretory pathway pseudopilin PulG